MRIHPTKHCQDCGSHISRTSDERCRRCSEINRGFLRRGKCIRDPIERFLEHVVKTPHCWIWTGSTNGKYGNMWFNGKKQFAHRISYKIHVGEISPDKEVMHNCSPLKDNKLCVNPKHLSAGSHAENMLRAFP